MNNIKFLLLGTSLSFIPLTVTAQCVATQECETLGYTETTCNGGKGVKCPFGNKWACLATEESVCANNGFKYICTGTGYSAGSGDSCGGKYKKCKCAANYVWNGSSCTFSCSTSYKYTCEGVGYDGGAGKECDGKYTKCKCLSGYGWIDGKCQILEGVQGNLFYCNGKVVGVKASGMEFFVGMEDFSRQMNCYEAEEACSNYSFCANVSGNLPTREQFTVIFSNRSEIDSLLSTYGGVPLTRDWYWSATYDPETFGNYRASMASGVIAAGTYNSRNLYVRPVLIP